MKTFSFSLLFTINTLICLAQSPRAITKQDSIEIEAKVKLSIQDLQKSLATNEQGNYLNTLSKEFIIDTFKIEEIQRLEIEIAYSNNGMVTSILKANTLYDQLLNKYYQQLLKKLNTDDKNTLRTSQRNWVQYRDSELELNGILMADYYSGGGTIQRLIASARVTELTKNRLLEIYDYLIRHLN